MEKKTIRDGISIVEIPEAGLSILCGCPENAVKFLVLSGVIHPAERNGVRFETGPNAILLSELAVQGGAFRNLGEFPILQMLYRQGMILPKHPNNTGFKPMIIGLRPQVEAQSCYVYLGNYGLTSLAEFAEAGMDAASAAEQLRMKRKFAFGTFRKTDELLDLRILDADAVELRDGVFIRRLGVNRYQFIHAGECIDVDLSLPPSARRSAPYVLPNTTVRREAFSVIHLGEGDGWDAHRPCMGSIVMHRGRPFLVDAGPNIQESLDAVGIGIDEIAGIFHTHAHDDHFVGLTALMRSERRIRYFAVPCVRLSVARKLAAIAGIRESDFRRYFDVHDLDEGRWNDIDGLEAFPRLSPHPLENTVFRFRSSEGDKTASYVHLADLTSFPVLESMITDDGGAPGIARASAEAVKRWWLEPADVKKIDAGGGMVHGSALDFADDRSPAVFISHTSEASPTSVGRIAEFGEESVLIAAEPGAYPPPSSTVEIVGDGAALAFLRSCFLYRPSADASQPSDRLLRELAAAAEPIRRAAGEKLLPRVESGIVLPERGSAVLLFGGKTIAAIGFGDPFGEESLLSDECCVFEARAETELHGWFLPYAVVEVSPFLLWRLREVYEFRLALAKRAFDFSWRKEYSVGIERIDAHHRTIFAMIAGIAEDIVGIDGCTDVARRLPELAAFAAEHFRVEEGLMRSASYPAAAEHGREHETLLANIDNCRRRLLCGDETNAESVVDFLKDWLLKHTLMEDRCYMPYLSSFSPRS